MKAAGMGGLGLVALLTGAIAAAQAPDTQKADRLFREGSAAYSAGNYKLAHADFAALVRLAPHVAAAHTAYGAVLLAEGQPLASVKELEEARRLDPKDVPAAINLGVGYRRLDRNGDAVRVFSSVAADVVFSSAEAISYAGALAATQQAGPAQTVIEDALRRDPQSAALQDALGALLAQRGDLAAAQQAFQRAISLDPNLALAHTHLGSLLLLGAQPSPAEAVTEFRAAERAGGWVADPFAGAGKGADRYRTGWGSGGDTTQSGGGCAHFQRGEVCAGSGAAECR